MNNHLGVILTRFLVAVWGICGAASFVALVIMIARPGLWAAWIDKENDYWVKRGRFTSEAAEKMKKTEKGLAAKFLLGAIFVCSIVVVYLLLHVTPGRPFRAMRPPAVPVPHRQPPH